MPALHTTTLKLPSVAPQMAKRQPWGAVEAEQGSSLELHRWLRTRS